MGIENIAWECDYPHSDTTWPHAPEALARNLTDVPDNEDRRSTHENAMHHFRFDPFAHRPREKCTVAAPRAETAGVDPSTRSHGGKPHRADTGPITTRDVTEQLMSAFRTPAE